MEHNDALVSLPATLEEIKILLYLTLMTWQKLLNKWLILNTSLNAQFA